MESLRRFGEQTWGFVKTNPKTILLVSVVVVLLLTWGSLTNIPLVNALKKTFGTVGALAVAATSVAEEAAKGFTALVRVFGPLGGLIVMGLVFTETGRGLVASFSGRSFESLKRAGKAIREISEKSPKFKEGIENGDDNVLDEAANAAEIQADVSDRLAAEAGSGDEMAIERLETAFESHNESVARAFETADGTNADVVSESVKQAGDVLEAETEPLFEDFHPIP
jgi:hypothetical protein